MTPSKILFYFCLFFIFGIFLAEVFTRFRIQFSFPLAAGLFFFIVLVCIFLKNKNTLILTFFFLFLLLGFWRFQSAQLKIAGNELEKYNDLKTPLIFSGAVIEEPDLRGDSQRLIVKPEKIYFDVSSHQNIKQGKILVKTNRYPEYRYGGNLEIKGELETPIVFEDFNYKDYLEKSGIFSTVYYPEIKPLDKGLKTPLSLFYSRILGLKNRFREVIYQNISPPQSLILGAVLLGDKGKISEELKQS